MSQKSVVAEGNAWVVVGVVDMEEGAELSVAVPVVTESSSSIVSSFRLGSKTNTGAELDSGLMIALATFLRANVWVVV